MVIDMGNVDLNGQLAVIIGTGPGLGRALANCFAGSGMNVCVAARNEEKLATLAGELENYERQLKTYVCDATEETDVVRLFKHVQQEYGIPDLVVYNAGAFQPANIIDIETRDFENCWRVGCLGGFLAGREAARLMLTRGRGTILYTGATASLRGAAGFANLAVGKFGLRALSQSMARELGPENIHVAHVIIDGQIMSERYAHLAGDRAQDGLLEPEAIAENYLHLHTQHRSSWTQELDLRPWVEKF